MDTVFAPSDAAFVQLLQSQGLRESDLLAAPDKLRLLMENHVLPGVTVPAAALVPGASWRTLNPQQQLTVAAPLRGALAAADLEACATLLHETNVVLVPPGVFPLIATPAPAPATTVAAAGGPADSRAAAVPVAAPAPLPAGFQATLDITKKNVNVG